MIRKILFGLVISLILINISFGFSDEKRELYQKTLNAASGDFERMEEFLEILNKKEEDFLFKYLENQNPIPYES